MERLKLLLKYSRFKIKWKLGESGTLNWEKKLFEGRHNHKIMRIQNIWVGERLKGKTEN